MNQSELPKIRPKRSPKAKASDDYLRAIVWLVEKREVVEDIQAMSKAEILEELPKLTVAERDEIRRKLAELDDDAWDREIAADAASGALDKMYEKLSGGDAGKEARPLNDLLDNPTLS